jgi:hypothetical protein
MHRVLPSLVSELDQNSACRDDAGGFLVLEQKMNYNLPRLPSSGAAAEDLCRPMNKLVRTKLRSGFAQRVDLDRTFTDRANLDGAFTDHADFDPAFTDRPTQTAHRRNRPTQTGHRRNRPTQTGHIRNRPTQTGHRRNQSSNPRLKTASGVDHQRLSREDDAAIKPGSSVFRPAAASAAAGRRRRRRRWWRRGSWRDS